MAGFSVEAAQIRQGLLEVQVFFAEIVSD